MREKINRLEISRIIETAIKIGKMTRLRDAFMEYLAK
jgi:hypothetical protein